MSVPNSVGFLTKKRGQRVCSNCSYSYNNRNVPKNCQCGYYLGGNYQPKEKTTPDAWLITSSLASVRANTGGIPTRCFVDLASNKVALCYDFMLT